MENQLETVVEQSEIADDQLEDQIEETEIESDTTDDDEILAPHTETGTADALRRFFNRAVEPKVTAYRPDLSNLKDAFEINADGTVKFLGKPGDKIVVEYGSSPWRDTQMLVVDKINDANGDVNCWSVEKGFYSPINYSKEAIEKYLLKIKFADKAWIMGRRPRGRKKADAKLGIDRSQTVPSTPKIIDPTTGKTRRGRPKGSKNKSTLEKLAKLQVTGVPVAVAQSTVTITVKRPPGRPKGSLNRSTLIKMAAEAAKKSPVA